MKRTLTAAAALLAGSAGAIGFAGTASAADSPELPAELPTDNNVAQTTYHTAATLKSAKQVVGDVVPAPNAATSRSGDGAPGVPSVAESGESVGDLLNAPPVDKAGDAVREGVSGRDGSSGQSTGGLLGGGSPLGGLLSGLPIG